MYFIRMLLEDNASIEDQDKQRSHIEGILNLILDGKKADIHQLLSFEMLINRTVQSFGFDQDASSQVIPVNLFQKEIATSLQLISNFIGCEIIVYLLNNSDEKSMYARLCAFLLLAEAVRQFGANREALSDKQ